MKVVPLSLPCLMVTTGVVVSRDTGDRGKKKRRRRRRRSILDDLKSQTFLSHPAQLLLGQIAECKTSLTPKANVLIWPLRLPSLL